MSKWPVLLLAPAMFLATQTFAAAEETPPGNAAAQLAFGPENRAGSALLQCREAGAQLSLWVSKAPHNTEGEAFTTMVRIYQGRSMLEVAAHSAASHKSDAPDAPTRLDLLLPDPAAFLAGAKRNGRLVMVSYAGRTMQPLPQEAAMAAFLAACPTARN